MGQVVMWNSEWRRRALVSNWDCIRLESAMRTPIVVGAAADDGLIKYFSQNTQEKRCGDCREGKYGPQGNWSQNLSAAFKTGISDYCPAGMWESRIPLWKLDRGREEPRRARRPFPRVIAAG